MKSIPLVLGLLLAAGAATAQQYTISTFAGIGTSPGFYPGPGLTAVPATTSQIYSPGALALDHSGNLYIADYLSRVIWEVTSGNMNPPVVGTSSPGSAGDDGPAVLATIYQVRGITVDPGGNLYIADAGSAKVRIVNPTGQIFTFAGNGNSGYAGDGGKATDASLISPAAVVADSSGNIYIADYGTHTVREVTTKGIISTIAGNGTSGNSGDGGPASKALLGSPVALAIDPANNIFILDFASSSIREITTDGNIHTVASFVSAQSIAVDSADNIYYVDYVDNTVQKRLANGTQFTIAGSGNMTPGFSGDGGPANSAQLYFNQAYGIAVDSSGNLYVSDSGNAVIRELKPVSGSLTIASAASGVGAAISPGEIVSLFGSNFGPSAPAVAQPDANGYYGTTLAGTTVSIGGYDAPILYTSTSQINAIVPYEVPVSTTATVTVNYQGQSMLSSDSVPVASSALSLFTLNSTGVGQAAAINQDGTFNSPSSPAHQGSIISLYLTGEGQTIPAGVNGKPASLTDIGLIPTPIMQLTVLLSGQPSLVTYQGGSPGIVAGLMQVNVQIPANLIETTSTAPVAVPVKIFNSSVFVTPGVTISVAP